MRPPREGGGGESERERERERERELYCELLHNEFVEPEHDGARARLGTIIFVIFNWGLFWGISSIGTAVYSTSAEVQTDAKPRVVKSQRTPNSIGTAVMLNTFTVRNA